MVTEEFNNEEHTNEKGDLLGGGLKGQTRPCELYVCNLPRSCDISELLEMFKPFGTVLSVEVTLWSLDYPVYVGIYNYT